MKKVICAIILFLSINNFQSVFSQVTPIDPQEEEEETDNKSDAANQAPEKKFWSKVVFGGNVGAAFGSTTYIDISPIAGYKVTPKLLSGVGFTYQYVNYNDPYGYYASYKANVIGPRIFSQYDLIFGIFAHIEYEHLWVSIEPEGFDPYKEQVPGLFPGLGYKTSIGGEAYFKIMALYNLLWDSSNVLYGSPFQIRLGFTFGG